jgi:hypothetical protein
MEFRYPGSGKAIIQIDLKNCFNIFWRTFCYLFAMYLGFIYRYVFRIYQLPKFTVYNGYLIKVIIGLIQGDGLGPIGCCLALAKLITDSFNMLLEKDKAAFNVNLMDDMTFGGNESEVIEVAKYIQRVGPESCGAVLNPPKTVIYVLDQDLKAPESRLDEAKRIVAVGPIGFDVGSKREENGTRQLGSPIGSDEFCLEYFLARFKRNYEPIMEKIIALKHPAAAWRLWQRLCVEGGMTHLFRSTPPHLLSPGFAEIEEKIRNFVEAAIFGRKVTDLQWKLCQLPFALSGWNFIPFDVLAPCAYLSSLLANKEAFLKLRPNASDRYEKEIQSTAELIIKTNPSAKLPDLSSTPKQKDLVRAVMESRMETLLETVDTRTRALIIGQRQTHASLWKNAVHTAEMFINPEVFQIAALFSIGAEIFPEVERCPVCNEADLDKYGDHALVCQTLGGVVHRHNDAYKVFVQEARHGLVAINVEHVIQITPEKTYKADIVLPYGIPGLLSQRTALDLVVTTNFCRTMVKAAAKEDLATAEKGADRKDKEHEEDLKKVGFMFCPLAFEATGGHTPEVSNIANYFITQNSLMTGRPFTELSVNFWQRLSVTLQRSNATAILFRRKRLIEFDDK